MQIGKLDQIAYFESPVQTNVLGALQTTWQDMSGNSPATPDRVAIISAKGSEAFESARTNARELQRVKLRYRADITTKCRMRWEDQYYQILAVDRSMRRHGELWLIVEAQGVL